MIIKNATKQRKTRIRKNIAIVSDRPRLSVSKSNNYCYAQVITPEGKTVVGISEKAIKSKAGSRMESAKQVGLEIAKLALAKKIKVVVFDKGSFAYHGRVKALAEGAREGGLQF
ncbi:MAG TPA: 50S ribosomal protein L18 [Patescibacteria group bacterium]|nr:50S ribosomal protein L18 [Patescibacteria group bacterium]